jgi:REP element-mobilizing transposase RayT
MPRKLRFDYPGATHHVFMRGVARSPITLDQADSEHALFLLARTVSRFEIRCHGWCYLPNHAHFLFTSELGNLSRAMHHLGMCMAQAFNQRYDRPGHLFQSRFGSRLISDDRYLLELARYLPLNPVRAGLCDKPADWPWSSYTATAGLAKPPWYLDSGKLIEMLGSVEEFVSWVGEGLRESALDEHGIPLPPPKPSLASLLPEDSDRGIAIAHFEHGYSKLAIAKHLGVSDSQIGRRLA